MSKTNIINELDKQIFEGSISCSEQVQIIELLIDYLDLKTIQQYADTHSMSYNGVKNHRKLIILMGKTYVIGND